MRKRILALLAASVVVLMSACSGNGGDAGDSSAQGAKDNPSTSIAEKATSDSPLSMLYMSGIYADSARSMADEFKEKTGYEVQVDDVPFASYHEKAMLDFTSGSGSYDVVAVNLSWLGEFAPYLEPLDSYIAENNVDVGDFIPSVLDACSWEESLFGFPLAPTPNMMTYRTDLIDTPPTTYEEYLQMAAEHNDPENGMYGISIPGKKEQYAVLYLVRLWAMGEDVADVNWNVNIGDEITTGAMKQLGDTVQYCDPAALSWGLEESINAFLNGNAAFCEAWPTLGVIQAADDPEKSKIVDNWAIAPFPEESSGMKQMSIWCVAINKDSKNKEAAFEWLDMYSSAEKQEKFYDEFGVLPSRTSFWEQEDIKASSIGPIGEGLKSALPKWRIPVSAELDTIMANSVSSYMAGQMTLEETMDFFKTELEKALQNTPPKEGITNYNAEAIEAALK